MQHLLRRTDLCEVARGYRERKAWSLRAEDDGEEQPCAWLWSISMENSSYQRQQVTYARLRRSSTLR